MEPSAVHPGKKLPILPDRNRFSDGWTRLSALARRLLGLEFIRLEGGKDGDMDSWEQDEVGVDVEQAMTLFGQDTVVTALRAMQELGVRQLPVVDEQHGALLGEVTEERLRQVWKIAPLTRMAELLSDPEGEGLQNSQPEVVDVASLVDFFGRHGRNGLN